MIDLPPQEVTEDCCHLKVYGKDLSHRPDLRQEITKTVMNQRRVLPKKEKQKAKSGNKGKHVFPMFPVPFSLFPQDSTPLAFGQRDSRQKIMLAQKEEEWTETTAEMIT